MPAAQRIGVYLCRRAGDEWSALDLAAVARFAAPLPGVRLVRVVLAPEDLEAGALAEQLWLERLEEIVIGGESPGFFKGAFARALSQVGGDPERIGSPPSASTARPGTARSSAPRPSSPAPCTASPSASPPSRRGRR